MHMYRDHIFNTDLEKDVKFILFWNNIDRMCS